MPDYPASMPEVNHVAPVPRRIRAVLGGQVVVDTVAALYVWEWPHYPQFYVPLGDIADEALSSQDEVTETSRGEVRMHTLRASGLVRRSAVQVLARSPIEGLTGTARLVWGALDRWFEEDEEVFVHPRDPYTRVDALRSTRTVRVELEGVLLAESPAPVMVFETGLPTRYYLEPTGVHFEHLVPSTTATACPYKGRTSGYWSADVGGTMSEDVAWTYSFPTGPLLAVAGLVAFLNEKVDVFIDGVAQPRPSTHMGR